MALVACGGKSKEATKEMPEQTTEIMDLDISKFSWTREPQSCVIKGDTIEVVTKPKTDLWQRTYYHFQNDNAPEAGRSGVSIVYHIYSKNEGDSFGDFERESFAYIAPGESKRDTLTLRHLLPGGTYELLVRERWPVAQSLTFTLPAAPTGIGGIVLEERDDAEAWYTIDGRKIARPDKPGIYLRRKNGVTKKMFVGNK